MVHKISHYVGSITLQNNQLCTNATFGNLIIIASGGVVADLPA